jgi:hypothetical protein
MDPPRLVHPDLQGVTSGKLDENLSCLAEKLLPCGSSMRLKKQPVKELAKMVGKPDPLNPGARCRSDLIHDQSPPSKIPVFL